MSINVVLVEPEIPQNTGNIIRTCAATGATLHLVKPLGFSLEDKYLKRSGLDYWDIANIQYYDSFEEVVEKNPKDVEDLLNQPAIFEEGKTVNEALIGKIATIGENLSIRRFARFESKGLLEKYIHGDGKIAVLINMTKGDKETAKDLCMQIAAARPEFVRREEVPQERVDKEMEILKAQAMNEGKPEQIAEKIVQGRVGKFYEEICLIDQVFVKDSSMKVSDLLKQKDADVAEFARFEKGEGIEKKEENFAEEVMKQAGI